MEEIVWERFIPILLTVSPPNHLRALNFSYLLYHLAGLLSGPFFFRAKSDSAYLRQPF